MTGNKDHQLNPSFPLHSQHYLQTILLALFLFLNVFRTCTSIWQHFTKRKLYRVLYLIVVLTHVICSEWSRRLYLADKWIDRICELGNEVSKQSLDQC